MAGPATVYNPTSGDVEEFDASQLARARQAYGAEPIPDAVVAKHRERQAHENSFVEGKIAQSVGKVRGIGEAFGFPVDAAAIATGEAFGKGQETQDYLNSLKEYHPIASGYGEIAGQVGGGVALGELTGGGKAATRLGRIGEASARGALENMVIGATSDVNEEALGDPTLAGEKLWARMPKHAAIGLVGGAIGGAVGEGAAIVGSFIKREAPGALDTAANRAIGREFGGDAALGAELRAKVGGVPQSRDAVVGALKAEQAAMREGTVARAMAERDALIGRHIGEAGQQSMRHEAERLAAAKENQWAIDALQKQHQAAREALTKEAETATESAERLGAERASARRQLKSLAADLDEVKGATLPDGKRILGEASAAFQPDPLTPPSQNAVKLFNEWTTTFSSKDSLSFRELDSAIKTLDVLEKRQRVMSGWGNDPDVKRAIDALRNSAKSEFDRASEATAASVSEAKNLSAKRLRDSLPGIDAAHEAALDNVDKIQTALADFEAKATGEVKQAQKLASFERKEFERGVRQGDKTLRTAQRGEEKALPKASKATPVDTLLGKVRTRPEASQASPMAIGGALVSLLHGNVAGAALSLVGGFAANTARAQGNLLAARTLSSLAEHIAQADGSIARLAGRAVGRYVRQGGEDAVGDHPSRKAITYEKASKQVKDIQANPLILEQRVRVAAGPWAQQAPGIYSSLLSAAIRQQEFLSSKLPPSRIDPYSLTPHLEEDDLSDSEKYDFVEYAKASADPVRAMRDVIDGHGSPQQVEAVAYIYPGIYSQAKAEIGRRIAQLQKPLEYERAVNIGTLLQMDTAEVMTGEFQTMLSDMYTARADSEKTSGGSKPLGVNSRLSKSMQSASEQMMGGG